MMLRGMTENILASRSQEKRAPLLAVVKPSSTRTLTKNITQQSLKDSQPGTSAHQSTPSNIFTSEDAKTHTDMTNVSMSQNSNNVGEPYSQVLSLSQAYHQTPSQICTHALTMTQARTSHFTNFNTQLLKETPKKALRTYHFHK